MPGEALPALDEMQSPRLALVRATGPSDRGAVVSLYSTAVQQRARGSQRPGLLALQRRKDLIPICPKVIAPNRACPPQGLDGPRNLKGSLLPFCLRTP